MGKIGLDLRGREVGRRRRRGIKGMRNCPRRDRGRLLGIAGGGVKPVGPMNRSR